MQTKSNYLKSTILLLFIVSIPHLVFGELLPISETEGDAIHVTQIIHATYNPGGPSGSNNCGPASFAMCLRGLGYLGYGNTCRLFPEEQVDHARALLYPSYYGVTTITRQSIAYTQLNRDSDYSDVTTHGPAAIESLGGSSMGIYSRYDLDKALDNGMPVVLYGYLDTEWRNQFNPPGHWGGTCGHYIAVTGKTANGDYIVNDPMYQYGSKIMNYTQLSRFKQYGTGVGGIAFYYKTPAPFAIKKASNNRVYVFMRKRSNGLIYVSYQTYANGPFSNFQTINSMAGSGNPVAIEQQNGRLLVFVRGTLGQVLLFTEDASGNYYSCTDFGGETYHDISIGKNQDGRVEFFVRGIDERIYKQYQLSQNSGFSGWCHVYGNTRTSPGAVRNADGRLEVFAGWKNSNTPLAHTWQEVPNSYWCNYWSINDLGGHIKGKPVPFLHHDGHLRVIVRSGSNNTLYYKTQRDGWYNWRAVGSTFITSFGQPANEKMTIWDYSYRTYYNDYIIFTRGVNNVTYWSRLKKRGSSYSWTSWGNIGGIATSDPAAARYANGRVFVTVQGTDGRLYYRTQANDYGGWSAWSNLGGNMTF